MDGENFMENPINKWMIWGENPLFLVQHQYLPIYIYISLNFIRSMDPFIPIPSGSAMGSGSLEFLYPFEP